MVSRLKMIMSPWLLPGTVSFDEWCAVVDEELEETMSDGWTATEFTNPRLRAVVENWPIGRGKRATAIFEIEQKIGRERAVRTTVGKSVKLTYATKARIVDGDDGRIYIAELTAFGHITFMRGDMKYAHGDAVFERDPRYARLRALFD
jgi:hypothetical protein